MTANDSENTIYYDAYVDGGCRNNGSVDAEAYGSFVVVKRGENVVLGKSEDALFQVDRAILNFGDNVKPTNNLAEAQSMFMLIATLNEGGILAKGNHTVIHSDSQLIIKQLSGEFKVNKKSLLKIYRNIYRLYKVIEEREDVRMHELLTLKKISGDEMKQILGH